MAKNWSTDELRRALRKVAPAVAKRGDEALKINAQEWVDAAKSAAPSDPDGGSFLRQSIRNEESDTGGQIVRAGGPTTTRDGANGPYDYARAQEFGRSDMQANPYFWPTYRLLKKRFISRRRRAVNQAIKESING
ncbi:HK97 gp10 family phage protein [Ancylobacter aquaticus]|uniref:HK97 gp10 family phage protein n=1 Tax=Ancylobacter aquaticus TaxID=100 RepID=A0A4R1I776_ANCAQ|nr:HK97-gp10 family putative phage morphogenesis protein [Ancylobacter aquaticus]TCK31237.1 HK97 gp10 family phage protein [Ancylobacter aquaticus]